MIFIFSFIAGLLFGLLGGGGAVLLIPTFHHVGGLSASVSVAGSLMTVGTCGLLGALRQNKLGNLNLRIGFLFSLVSAPAAILGSKFGVWLGGFYQMLLFAIVVLISASIMLFKKESLNKVKSSNLKILLTALGVGILIGTLGVGGGFLIVPALISGFELPMHNAAATSTLIIAISALTGWVAHPLTFLLPKEIYYCTIIVLLGMLLGIQNAQKIKAKSLKKGFAVFLLIMGIFLLLGGE